MNTTAALGESQTVVARGGFLDHRPGLAATAAAMLTAPVTGSVASRVSQLGGAVRVLVTPHQTRAVTWLPNWRDSVESMLACPDGVDDRVALALFPVVRNAARSELMDPVERALHHLETHVWGHSRWSMYWGAEDTHHLGDDVARILSSWSSLWKSDEYASASAWSLRGASHRLWAGGVVEDVRPMPGDDDSSAGGRVEIAVAVPVAGVDAALHAAIASTILCSPLTGPLYRRLREQLSLVYGLLGVPLVRGTEVALAVMVSTATSRAQECVRRLAYELQRFIAVRISSDQALAAVRNIERAHAVAASHIRAGLSLSPYLRSLMESGCRPLTLDRVLNGICRLGVADGAPCWFLRGRYPEGTARIASGAW